MLMLSPLSAEDILIQRLFDLLDEAQAKAADAHIVECSECRRQSDALKKRFELLDVLADEVSVPDELMGRVLQNAQSSAKRGIIPFDKPVWVAAAAAVIVVASLVSLVFNNDKAARRGSRIADGYDLGEKAVEEVETVDVEIAALDDAGSGIEHLAGKGIESTSGILTANHAVDIESDPLAEKPFAPASAIELVTLPRREDLQLTIYNSADMTLVREKRRLTMKRGWNWLQLMWANTLIDATSLTLRPVEHADKVEVEQLVYPARLKDIGRWLIRSEITGAVEFEITYLTSGIRWRAFYMGMLSEDEKTMQLDGYVRIDNNSGEEYENARTRLIVGKVNLLDQIAQLAQRQYPYGRPDLSKDLGRKAGAAGNWRWSDKDGDEEFEGLKSNYWYAAPIDSLAIEAEPKSIKKEGLSEYFLYTIEGTETIPDKWGKRLGSFSVDGVEVESLYKYDEQRWGGRAVRFLSFANDEDHELGETPIPNGNVRIYRQNDPAGHLSYVGGTDVKYIPVDEEVELNLGSARNVSVKPVLTNYKTARHVFDRHGDVVGWDEVRSWKIEVTNARRLPVKIEITRGFGTNYWKLEQSNEDVEYEKYDLTHARFTLDMKPQTKRNVFYTVTTYHGTRQEELSK